MKSDNQNKIDIKTFKEGNIPLYFQFFLMFRNKILLGEILPGSRIPPIEELHEIYAVSHATIRKAMAVLEKEGIIIKKRGAGTMVREDVDLIMLEKRIPENVLNRFDRKFIECKWIDPPNRIANIFINQQNAYKDGCIFFIRILWVSLEQPKLKRVVDTYLQAPLVEEIGEENFSQKQTMQDQLNRLIDEKAIIDEILRPWICDAEMSELLGIADGTPLFHRTWIMSNSKYNVIGVSEGVTTATSYTGQ